MKQEIKYRNGEDNNEINSSLTTTMNFEIHNDGNKIPSEGFYATFDTLEILGKGLSSVVRRAIEKSSGKEYAVKIIDITDVGIRDADNLTIREQVIREVRILQRVNDHNHIVRLHRVYESRNSMFLLFDLCVNGELFDLIDNNESSNYKLSEKRSLKIMRQILKAVLHCHDKNIIHRDLKPENVLLDEHFNVKLTDFGFAKLIDPSDRLYEVCGTPGYLAPEVLKSGMHTSRHCDGYNSQADMWSSGVILYSLISSEAPFHHRKQLTMIRMIMEGKYNFNAPIWKTTDECTKDLIRRMLTVDPSERITPFQALNHPALIQEGVLDDEDCILSSSVSENISTNSSSSLMDSQNINLDISEEKLPDYKRKFRVYVFAVLFSLRIEKNPINPKSIDVFDLKHNPYCIKSVRKELLSQTYDIYSYSCHLHRQENMKLVKDMYQHVPMRKKSSQNVNDLVV